MSSDQLISTWQTTTFRLAVLYGGIFAVGVVCVLALVYYLTAKYIDQQVDQILEAQVRSCRLTPRDQLPNLIADAIRRDVRHIDVYGVFGTDGKVIAGNLKRIPPGLIADGQPHSVKVRGEIIGARGATSIRGLITVLPSSEVLLLGREERQVMEIQHIIVQAIGGAMVIAVIGVLFGIRLSIVPVQRINGINQVSRQIVNGEIGLRLPVSPRGDEIDMLATIVNRMLDEIERRLVDIKGAADSVAHNLRTPLTRLRVMLNRLTSPKDCDESVIEQAIAEADDLLARFRALLRISEISGSVRHSAFEKVNLRHLLESIRDIYEPLAEEKSIIFELHLSSEAREVLGDGALLFEAVLNLADNAIKFTPAGGHVEIRLESNSTIIVTDDGPGIREEELKMVMQPFYRGVAARSQPGSGVGLGIVGAIAHLHGFDFEIFSKGKGVCATLHCLR